MHQEPIHLVASMALMSLPDEKDENSLLFQRGRRKRVKPPDAYTSISCPWAKLNSKPVQSSYRSSFTTRNIFLEGRKKQAAKALGHTDAVQQSKAEEKSEPQELAELFDQLCLDEKLQTAPAPPRATETATAPQQVPQDEPVVPVLTELLQPTSTLNTCANVPRPTAAKSTDGVRRKRLTERPLSPLKHQVVGRITRNRRQHSVAAPHQQMPGWGERNSVGIQYAPVPTQATRPLPANIRTVKSYLGGAGKGIQLAGGGSVISAKLSGPKVAAAVGIGCKRA
eukprot:TRINITY_DN113051_c0_g1_i1.p1 TRINITY_DN113051_c0_g1~~TRINITY_DN113051_c0_g1_i1.p1  ORF type:complete len:282 (+),score=7.60 TRINITY_DN113051_c0_g1_i1:54-899(+)